jgi:hypothetical protein
MILDNSLMKVLPSKEVVIEMATEHHLHHLMLFSVRYLGG